MSFQTEAFENLVAHRTALAAFYSAGAKHAGLVDPDTPSEDDENAIAEVVHEELSKDGGGAPAKVELEVERGGLVAALGNAFHRRSGRNQGRISRMAHFASIERESARKHGALINVIRDVGDFNVNNHSK